MLVVPSDITDEACISFLTLMTDYFRPAKDLLYSTMDTKDGDVVATDDGLQDGWASDGETTLFEESHESFDNLPEGIGPMASEADDLRALTVL